MNTPSGARARGFTLIEVLLATVLLAAGLALAFASLRAATGFQSPRSGWLPTTNNSNPKPVFQFVENASGTFSSGVKTWAGACPPPTSRIIAAIADCLSTGAIAHNLSNAAWNTVSTSRVCRQARSLRAQVRAWQGRQARPALATTRSRCR